MPELKKSVPESGAIYVQPSVRNTTWWTPALMRAAELSADGGHLRSAADCFDWVLTDERARGVLESRVGHLLGAPLTFEAGARRARVAGRVKRALELQEDWDAMLPSEQLVKLMVWGIGFGVGLGELFPWEDRMGRLVPRLRWWHPRWLRYDSATAKWVLTVAGYDGTAGPEIEINPGDRRWILYCPFGMEQPHRFGLWRGMKEWRLLKSLARDDWGRHSENAARLVVKAEKGTSAQARKELADRIRDAGKNAIIDLPPGFDPQLIELTANTRDIYDAQIQAANTSFAIAVLGQNLTTEVKGGSYAASQTSSEVESRRIRYDADVASNILHDQVLVPWSEVNFGSADVAPWPIWDVEPPKDTVKWASTLAQAIPPLLELESRFLMAGLPSPIDWEEVFKDLGVPLRKGYDFLRELEAAKLAKESKPEPVQPPPQPPPEKEPISPKGRAPTALLS